jgi:hypothetical protein
VLGEMSTKPYRPPTDFYVTHVEALGCRDFILKSQRCARMSSHNTPVIADRRAVRLGPTSVIPRRHVQTDRFSGRNGESLARKIINVDSDARVR